MKELVYMEEKKKIKKEIILVLLGLLLITVGIFMFYLTENNRNKNILVTDREVSDKQNTLHMPENHKSNEDEYTELIGFGLLEINKENPFVYLMNPSDNEVYLSFDVFDNDELIYESKLIEPGNMEELDIYSRLNAGEHTLVYSISSYELETKAVLWSGIRQNQDIYINKRGD